MQTLDPLVYYTLKAHLLELSVQELQIQLTRQKAMLAAGLMPGQYVFDDNQTAVLRVDGTPQSAQPDDVAAPPAEPPLAPDAEII